MRSSSWPVVILNMHYTGLALARGLQGCGASPIYGTGANDTLFGNCSRYCRYIRSPDTESAPEQCRDFLMDFGRRFDTRPLLFPTRDHDLQFLGKFYVELQRRYVIVAAPPPLLQTILNKAALYQVAHELGIPCPATAWINSYADLEKARDQLTFPAIVKPVYASQWRKKKTWDVVGRQKAAVIEDYDELCRFYARLEPVDPMIHIQEFVPGGDSDLVIFGSYANPASGLIRYFTGRKLLQYPPRSGTGVAVQACRVPEIVGPSQMLLARLGYRGASEIEYKHDPRSGKHVLIEMNPRFWDQHGLGIGVGVNLAQCSFLDLTGARVPEQSQDTTSVTWIGEDGYLVAFASNLKNSNYAVGDFLRALKGRHTFAVFDCKDLRPAISVAMRLVREFARAIFQRITSAAKRQGTSALSIVSRHNKRTSSKN